MSGAVVLRSRGLYTATACLVFAHALMAQTQVGERPDLFRAARLRPGERIVLDGRPTEPAWASSPAITDLRQYDPDVGAPATERTEVRVLFDSTTLYVAVTAFDSKPGDITSRILARDQIIQQDPFNPVLTFGSDDAVAILLDPFRDGRNALIFATNPNGAEFDAQITDQGREINLAWRTVWRVAAARTDSGWSAEFAIPLRSIRHPTDGRPWGFNVARMIRRKNEEVLWRSWSRDNAGFLKVSEAGELAGISGLAREGIGLEVKTSAIGRAVTGDVSGRRTPADGALDIKYEVRPGVTLDATANTDFAQADVDDVQINLTRFSLFFPERRDFFLENAGVFEFGARSIFETPPWLMFFSRRIGISDSGVIPVLGGLRLTGREGPQTFGALHMHTRAAFDQPYSSYTVARYKRDVGQGGYLGAMYSGLLRGARQAGSGGLDFQYWPTSTINMQGFASAVYDSTAQFLRPESRAYRVMANREMEHWGLRLERIYIGKDADPPLGFATRTDIQRSEVFLRRTFRPPMAGVRRVQNFLLANYIARTNAELQDWNVGPAVEFAFNSGEDVTFYHIQSHTVLDSTFTLTDRLPIGVGGYDNSQTGFLMFTSPRRPASLTAMGQYQQFYSGTLWTATSTLLLAIAERGTLAVTRVFNEATVPAGHLVTNVTALRAGYAFSTRTTLSTTLQYDALDRVLRANARFVYIYRPGSELFIVLNGARDSALMSANQPRAALLKFTYLARM